MRNRYLERAIATGGEDAIEVDLRMHGEIRLEGRWRRFRAKQRLAPGRGFLWRAMVWAGPVLISGFDRYENGHGEMKWRLFGLVPVLSARGPDLDRSARGRLACEAIWAPATLLPERGVEWSAGDGDWLAARFEIDGNREELRLQVDGEGRVRRLVVDRWGNPDDEGWRVVPFGGEVLEEGRFGPLTVPRRLAVGWWPDEERFAEGEFFRVVVDSLTPV